MAKNLKTICKDIADAIRTVKNSEDLINPQDFSEEILSISGGSTAVKWTGHADAEGLRAIGWTEEDIQYYQEHGVNWNEEDDEHHKVSDDNKALYGVLTASNIYDYKDRIVYLPKIDMSKQSFINYTFDGCSLMVAIPMLNTSYSDLEGLFRGCSRLTCIPKIDTSRATNMAKMFMNCTSLIHIPDLVTDNAKKMEEMFAGCRSLNSIPCLNTTNVTTMKSMFSSCYNLINIPQLDMTNVTDATSMCGYCYSLEIYNGFLNAHKIKDINGMFSGCTKLSKVTRLDISSIKNGLDNYQNMFSSPSVVYIELYNMNSYVALAALPFLSKDSLLYIINNEAATRKINILLHKLAYSRLANDADVVAALANHPNISLGLVQ